MKAATKEGKFKTPDTNFEKRFIEENRIYNLLSKLERKRELLYEKARDKYSNIKHNLDNIKFSTLLGTGATGATYSFIKLKNYVDKKNNENVLPPEELFQRKHLIELILLKPEFLHLTSKDFRKLSIKELVELNQDHLSYKKGGSLIIKHKSGKQITETPRDNTNYERKTPLVKKKK